MHPPGSSEVGRHTLSEIFSQPVVWPSAVRELSAGAPFQNVVRESAGGSDWLFVGCGTSYYLAEAAAWSWTVLTGHRARAVPASEIMLFPQVTRLNGNNLQAIVISRSGRTSEAVRAAEVLSSTHKVPTLALTCTPDSELAKSCDAVLSLPAADEKSMVMTRSFTSMLFAILQLATSDMGGSGFLTRVECVAAALSAKLTAFNERVTSFVNSNSFADYVYLGQGPFFSLAREAALKITEMSCSYAQPYHTLEFRHGPKSIVSPETCLTFFLSESAMQAESEVLAEMKDLGGIIVAICNRATDTVRRCADLLFELDAGVPEVALVAPFAVPAQLLGFHTGIRKGFDPDQPKNLSRVVILD